MPQGDTRASDAAQLAASELARDLGPDALTAIAPHIRYLDLTRGQVLVSEGEAADELFLLLGGELEVVLHAGDEAGEQTLTRLGPGATVGEIALLAGDRRSATVRAAAASRVAAISDDGFRQLLRERPAHAEALARRALQRLRETQLVSQLNRLFGNLEPEVLATINDFVEWVPARAGTKLFGEGEEGDAAYFVVTGRLHAFRADASGTDVPVGEIRRGEMAGEMALLEEAPRSASVYAVRDSQLVRFSKTAFDALISRYPRAGLLVAQTVLRRARLERQATAQQHLSVVVVPTPGIDGEAFGRQLAAALGPEARYVSSGRIDDELGVPGIAQVGDDDLGSIRLAYWLEELQERHRFLVYGIDDEWSGWSRRALRWADEVLVVADATADPAPGPLEQELWRQVSEQKHPTTSLALVHPPGTELPSGTRRWLDVRPVTSHHHLVRDDAATIDRLARRLSGTATSLVLGGGGARGFAHLGVFVVLEELGVPIDMVAGASIGAIMAIGPGLGYSAEQCRVTATEQFRAFMDYTLPSVSVLKGGKIADKLTAALGDVDITDLWIPYFCVSTNLTTPGAHYHDRGRLVDAVRASLAIPGLLPPVPLDGQLLVDGGVLDNVPVDEMRRRNPTGSLIAVDVAAAAGPEPSYDYGLSVSGFRAILDRRRGAGPPGMLSTLVRSSLIASVRDRERVVREGIADLYLDVDVSDVSLLDFKAADHIATSAEISTRPILRRWVQAGGPAELGYVRTTASRGAVADERHRRSRGLGVILLTMRDLQHRAVRFAAVIAGTAVVLALLFLMTGLVEQFHREPDRTVDALGAEGWLLREGVSGAFTAASTMPAEVAAQIDGAAAAPIVVARHSITDPGGQTDVVVIGFEAGGLGQPTLRDGEYPTGPGQALVDESSGHGVGDEVLLGDERFTVTGTTDDTTMFAGMPLVFMAIGDAQELVYRGQPLATSVLLDTLPDPADVPDGFVVRTPDEIAEDGLRPLDGAISSINLARILLWFVAAMIIGTMIYLSALERRRDVAVLKAVGGSTTQMGSSIALQGVITALVAALIASVLQLLLAPIFPLEVTVPTRAFWQVPLIAVLVALLSGAVGLRKAVSVDPALAFAGPGS